LPPVFVVDGERFVMATHLLAAVPRREPGPMRGRLDDERAAIMNALDLPFAGI
jgi:hypothetical protein